MRLFERWILKKAEKYEIISFDVYDTLIHRKYAKPSDVFRTVEKKLYMQNIEEHFYEKRCMAEQMARKKVLEEEITLEDIYQYYEADIDKKLLKKLEIETELECIYPDEKMKNIFEVLKEKNKKIVIISDMYLQTGVIEKALKEVGYSGYERIFVSSEVLMTKKSGHLFRYVRNELGGQQFIHIGDRFSTDYRNAKNNGLESIWYARPRLDSITGRLSKVRNNV